MTFFLHRSVGGALVGILASLSLSAQATPLAIPAPKLDSTAYVLMDYDSGQILAQSNGEQPLPPASLTKMMTSYIVEQALRAGRLKPTDQVQVSLNAWCHGSSTESCMYLPLHGSASVMDILRGIIIQSGNDASKAIAEHLAGSEAGFADLMNHEAKRLGMVHTHFANPTGLPDPTHRASAQDLAILARAIIHDSADYYPLYAEKTFKYNGIQQGNRNALLYTDPSVDGLKTGHTNEAGYCLTASAKRNGMRLISVLMGSHSMQGRADETRALFNWGFSAFEETTPVRGGQVLANAPVQWGLADSVPAGLAQDWSLTLPRGQSQALSTSVQLDPHLTAPIAKGAVIGKVVAMLDHKPYAERPLVAQQAVAHSGLLRSAWQHLRRLSGF
ncbi:MAG: D-alanyl-D-alanine carboxypeptidase [Burkholderiales bacterium]|nr:D-alanyl-D-alanine carboxypeptidase [Burkholderiales bacterium]